MTQQRSFNASRRRIAFAAAALSASGLGLLHAGSAAAQGSWPSKPITIIVPFSAGGTTDILARVVGQSLGTELGQTVIIDNRPGAGGNIGAAAVARAAPDGYTLLMGTVGTHAINEALYKKMPFEPQKDFAPLTRVALVPNVLVVPVALPYKTVSEIIAAAKSQPGKMTYASSGTGTSIHLSGELFKSMTGTDIIHIPYKGSAPAMTDLLGGQVMMMFDNLPSAIQHIRSGKLRAIAVTSGKRAPELPDVPTIAESGVKGFEATSWFGMFAPAGTPPEVVAKLNTAIVKLLGSPEVKKRLSEQGAEPHPEKPEQFAAFIRSEATKWGKVVKESGATVD